MIKQQYITRKDKFNFYGSFSKEIGLEICHCNKDKIHWLHDLNSLKFVHNFFRHVMYRKAISKLIAIEPWSAIMNFIIHTHLSIFKKKLRVLKQFISYLMKKLRHYIRSRI